MDPVTGLRSDSDAAIEPAKPREAAEWLRSNGVTLAAVTLIAIQLLWMGDLLAHSYFRQDDFSYLYGGLDSGWRRRQGRRTKLIGAGVPVAANGT